MEKFIISLKLCTVFLCISYSANGISIHRNNARDVASDSGSAIADIHVSGSASGASDPPNSVVITGNSNVGVGASADDVSTNCASASGSASLDVTGNDVQGSLIVTSVVDSLSPTTTTTTTTEPPTTTGPGDCCPCPAGLKSCSFSGRCDKANGCCSQEPKICGRDGQNCCCGGQMGKIGCNRRPVDCCCCCQQFRDCNGQRKYRTTKQQEDADVVQGVVDVIDDDSIVISS